MNAHHFTTERPADGALKGVIEPLVNYICAAERPRAALFKAYRALLREVEQTNRTAQAHFGVWGEGR